MDEGKAHRPKMGTRKEGMQQKQIEISASTATLHRAVADALGAVAVAKPVVKSIGVYLAAGRRRTMHGLCASPCRLLEAHAALPAAPQVGV